METQNQIKRTLGQPENIDRIRRRLTGPEVPGRTALAAELCRDLNFFDPVGNAQLGTCAKALRDLERQGHFVLPASARAPQKQRSPRRLLDPVPLPVNVPDSVGEVDGLQLVLVEGEEHLRLWNEMMIREHPWGAGPLVGRQLRYLIGSEHGWLGGLGFGASALQLRDRDRWIGWDRATHRVHLHRVVGLCRFLIRTEARCHNLASWVLGRCMDRLPSDFEARYGLRPWLVETFVEPGHLGTCFRATNWEQIGHTQGRGRQDRENAYEESVKEIYIYPLDRSFRTLLGVPPPLDTNSALGVAEGIDGEHWAEHEFGGAQLGDRRLTQRLVASAAALAQSPGRAFCGAVKSDWPAVKAHYRFIDQPDDSAVTMENILAPHRQQTIRRMKSHEIVLAIQDGSDLNYSGRPQCQGLGVIGTNQTGAQSSGLHLHSTLAVTATGTPLGVLRAECAARQPRPKEDERPSSAVPIEEKRTFSWIQSYRDCVSAAREVPKTRIVSVSDREADFFELFDEQRNNPGVDLLVRAMHDRTITKGVTLFDVVRESPVRGNAQILVRRESARHKTSKAHARPVRLKRTAEVSLRYHQTELRPAKYLSHLAPITLWVVHVLEEHPPEDAEPIEWFLLTTFEVDSAEQVKECLSWYCLRWRIEDWHRVLKSGCQVEHLAHRTAVRLRRSIAINLVIAWRIMVMTLLGREQPELPADVVFSDLELEVLTAMAKKTPESAEGARSGRASRRAHRGLRRS